MQFLRLVLLLAFFFTAFSAQAATTSSKKGDGLMQWGSDESTLDRKTHIVSLKGDAFLYREKEVLRADLIRYDRDTNWVHAEGRVQYQYGAYFIRADQMDIDLVTKAGTMINGNVSTGKFALRGSQIDQLEPGHYHVKDYDYSTCYDCPNAWEITGSDVDMTIDGYAFIQNFAFKVKDVPTLWLPYVIMPVKTKRQSGLLFPKFGRSSDYGFYFVVPYYWAINRYSDMTIGVGDYSARGARFEWEGRYAITPRSQGTMNLYWIRDSEIPPLYYRWAATAGLTQEFPDGFEGKLHLNEVSDNNYPIRYGNDVIGRQEPNLTSDLFFSKNDTDVSASVSFRRIRNLLLYNGATADWRFDPATVQEFPRIVASTNDHFLFDQKLAWGVEGRFNRFARAGGPFDTLTDADGNSLQVVREANRFTLIPSLYSTLQPLPWLTIVPSVQYRSFFYNFMQAPGYPNLFQGYLLAQAEASFQVERTFKTDDPDVTYRHTIRPTLTYSVIPDFGTIQSSDHNFVKQVQSIARPGQYFDDWDIVPRQTTQNVDSYFTPLGNSLTYGAVTQLYKRTKKGTADAKVERRMEAGVSQTFDMYVPPKVAGVPDASNHRIALSPLFTHFLYQTNKFTAYFEYTYYAFLSQYDPQTANLVTGANPNRFSSTFSWSIDHAINNGLLLYDRSIYLNYSYAKLTGSVSSLQVGGNYSLNDYIMPKWMLSYNLVKSAPSQLLEAMGSVLFQSPSKCWQAELGLDHSIDRGSSIIFNVALNVAGDAYTNTKN